jgi:hypothetical protein
MAKTISAKAASLDIILEQGAGFTQVMTKKDSSKVAMDLSGYTGRLTVKSKNSATTALMELTTENGGISLGIGANNITFTITEAAINAFTWTRGIYNFYLTPAGEQASRELTGIITIDLGT